MNKVLSDTRYVLAFAALLVVCATVLVSLDKVLWPDAVKVLSGVLGGLIMAWKRGSELTEDEAKAVKAFEEAKKSEGSNKTSVPPVLPVLGLFLVLLATGCAGSKPYIRTADDAATWACAAFYGQKQGLSLEDAAQTFCKTKAQLQPWIDQLLALERQGLPREKCESATEVTVTVAKDAGAD
jgi:hypothetical protein